jgi:IS30 family transposase
MPYSHLTDADRDVIAQLLFSGMSKAAIARELGRDRSTISRELIRNRVRTGSQKYVRWQYLGSGASKLARQRRASAKEGLPRLLDSQRLLQYVKHGLKQRWSPEQISGRIRREHPNDSGMRVSHQTIYQWLRDDKKRGGNWYRWLRQSKRKRRKKYGSSLRRYRIQNQTSIEQRPQIVDLRKRLGDWEGDTVEGKNHQGRLLTLVDRKSRYTLSLKLTSKYSHEVIAAVQRALKPLDADRRRTLTLDNGTEFTYFQRVVDRLKTKVYFAHPYSSWERGTNENTNGLLRQYFPKDTNFLKISHQQLAAAVKQLNNRPRKCLNWRTPSELFLAK